MTQQFMRAFLRLRHNEEGQALIEYALILVMVSIAAVTVLNVIGGYPASALSQINADF